LASGSGAVHADALFALKTSLGVSFYGWLVKRFTAEVYDFKVCVYDKFVGFVDEFVFALNLIPNFLIFHT